MSPYFYLNCGSCVFIKDYLSPVRKNIILYGIILALTGVALKLLEYRLVLVDHSMELYGGAVAIIFTIAGIAAGQKLMKPKEVRVEVPVHVHIPSGYKPDDNKLEQLGISKREYEILELISQGLSNDEIAAKMFLSVHTVKTHISNLFTKLDVKRRTQAVVRAREMGIMP